MTAAKKESDTYKEVRPLPVKVTRDELFKLAQEASHLADERDGLQLEAKSIADSYKGRMNQATDRIRSIYKIIRDEAETQEVPCTVTLDYKHGKATVVRDDTGEVVAERALTPAECQLDMDRNTVPPPTMPNPGNAPGKKVGGKAKAKKKTSKKGGE